MPERAKGSENTNAAPESPRACPICGRPSIPQFKPFCSKRCADVDLARWLGGRYAIPAAEEDPEDGAPSGNER